jgi:hypothetical protein
MWLTPSTVSGYGSPEDGYRNHAQRSWSFAQHVSEPADMSMPSQVRDDPLPFSVYEAIIPGMIHGLNVVDDYINHAQALADRKGWPEQQVFGARLAPDMLTFGEQVAVLCNKVDAHVAKLLRRDAPAPRQIELSQSALKDRVAETVQFLKGLAPEDLAGAENHTFELSPPIVRGWFGGSDYIFLLVMPDFFFHVATAHDILRHLGAPLGKRDYLGRLSQESGGAYS